MNQHTAPSFLVRFWSRVTITETCWLWTGAVSGDGYGRMRARSYVAPAHQLAYELITGEPWPGGMDGHHVCEVRGCIRPHPDHVIPREPIEHRGSHGYRRTTRG